jgi:uncharacterized protein (DUF58 family)
MQLRATALGAKGALFFAAVVLLFFATPYSNLFFLLTAFLAVLGVLGVLGCGANVRGIGVELQALAAAPATAGHDVAVALRTGRRARFALRVGLVTEHGVLPVDALQVARGDVAARGRLPGLPRGVHEVRAVAVESSHPFGLCRARRQVPAAASIVAYPVPAQLREGREVRQWLGDADAAPAAAPGTDAVAGLREFRVGDALRDVHWKATARRSAPIVREREAEHREGIELVLDRRAPEAAFERALSLCTAVVLRAAEQQRCVHLRSQGHGAVYGPGHRPPAEALRWLAAAAPLPAAAAPPPPAGPGAVQLGRPRPEARDG